MTERERYRASYLFWGTAKLDEHQLFNFWWM